MITTKRARIAALTFAATAALAFAGAGAAQAEPPDTPAISLNNGQETTDAKGGAHGFFSYTVDGDELCYTLEVDGLTAPAAAAHIHFAPRTVAGDIVIPLTVVSATSFTVSGCVVDSDAAAVAASPSSYYVNVHTSTYPGGEIRGQLK
jgi:Cu/Zn superoxide dismutase